MKNRKVVIAAAAALILIAGIVLIAATGRRNSETSNRNSELKAEASAKPEATEAPTEEIPAEPEKTEHLEEKTPAEPETTESPEETVQAEPDKTEHPEESAPAATETTAPSQAEGAADQAGETVQEQPFLVQITDSDPSVAYVLVRMSNPIGLLPLPIEGEYTRTIRQTMADGSEAINVLHLTPDGFWMEEANCEGQDCVGEGMVTLENREERVLWNMVICLPHQLVAELITREEAKQMLGQ
jgi:flagellar biosynthesis GTPase FlhF